MSAAAPVSYRYDTFVQLVTTVLARAQAAGRGHHQRTTGGASRLPLLMFQGAALVGRARPDRDQLAAAIDVVIDALRSR